MSAGNHEVERLVGAQLEPEDVQTGESRFVSYYGGGTYRDVFKAAVMLSQCADELSAPDILQVLGGLGAAFSAHKLAHPDNPWELSVTYVDTRSFLNEADVWAAAAMGDTLLTPAGDPIAGVVPLPMCDGPAHRLYQEALGAVAHLQLGAQLHGGLPRQAWSWMPVHPPYTLAVGCAAREAAVLRCLAGQSIGASNRPSMTEACLAVALYSELMQRSALLLDDPLVVAARGLLRGESQESSVLPLPLFTAALLEGSKNGISPHAARVLYWQEVLAAALRSGKCAVSTPAQAAEARRVIIQLIAATPEFRIPLTEDQVLTRLERRLEGGSISGAPAENQLECCIASTAMLTERLAAIDWLCNPEIVAGLCRISTSVGASGDQDAALRLRSAAAMPISTAIYGECSNDSGADTGALFAAAAVATAFGAGTCIATELRTPEQARAALKGLLEASLREEWEQTLNAEVTTRLLQQRAEARRLGAQAIVSGSEPRAEDARLDRVVLGECSSIIRGMDSYANHLSLVLCGHAGSGKSTLAGRLLVELGVVSKTELDANGKLAEELGRKSSMFAFVMDSTNEERQRGTSCVLSKRGFSVGETLCSLIDVPGRRDALKHTMRGLAQADVGLLLVPADAAAQAMARPNPSAGMAGGGSQLHAELCNLAGIRRLIVLVNKMDTAGFSQEVFEGIRDDVWQALARIGWNGWGKDRIQQRVLVLPVSAWMGDNLIRSSSTSMPWWAGQALDVADTVHNVSTLMQGLDLFCAHPRPRDTSSPLLMPVSGVMRIAGVGTVVTGRLESGHVNTGADVRFVGSGITCSVKSIESHHQTRPNASAGDIVGLNLRSVHMNDIHVGDVLTLASNPTQPVSLFTAEIIVRHISGKLTIGCEPMLYCRTALARVRMEQIKWKTPRGTSVKLEGVQDLESGDHAQVVFHALQPLLVDTFEACQGLSRIAVFDAARGESAMCIMFGKVVQIGG